MLKKSVYIFLIFLLFIYCSSQKKKIETPEIIIISGKVEVWSTNEVYIVENWETRSRINYKLVEKNDVREFYKKAGRIFKVKAKIIEKSSPWSGKIKIVKILEEIEAIK